MVFDVIAALLAAALTAGGPVAANQGGEAPKPSLVHYKGECQETVEGQATRTGACTIMVLCKPENELHVCIVSGQGQASRYVGGQFRRDGSTLTLDTGVSQATKGTGTVTDSELSLSVAREKIPGRSDTVSTFTGKFDQKIY